MKIGGFEPLSLSDYPQTLAAVIFTQGCNWQCPYCHNQQLMSQRRCAQFETASILDSLHARRHLLGGVVVTGGEPTLHHDLIDFLMELKKIGLKVKLDTNGSNPAVLETILSLYIIDYLAMDIKAPWHKYGLLTGVEDVDVESVQESMRLIASSHIDYQLRTTFDRRLLDEADITLIRKQLPAQAAHKVQTCRTNVTDHGTSSWSAHSFPHTLV